MAGPDHTSPRAHPSAGPGAHPRPMGTGPGLAGARPSLKPYGTAATVAKPGRVAPGAVATGPEGGDPSSTDILPDKPRSRFRLRFR